MKRSGFGTRPATALLLTAALLLLAGCRGGNGGTEESFSLVIENQCGGVYGIHCEYALDGEAAGGQIASRTPEMDVPQEMGEELWFTFTPRDFPAGGDPVKLELEFYAVGADGAETPAGERFALAARYGERYDYLLSEGPEGRRLGKK